MTTKRHSASVRHRIVVNWMGTWCVLYSAVSSTALTIKFITPPTNDSVIVDWMYQPDGIIPSRMASSERSGLFVFLFYYFQSIYPNDDNEPLNRDISRNLFDNLSHFCRLYEPESMDGR